MLNLVHNFLMYLVISIVPNRRLQPEHLIVPCKPQYEFVFQIVDRECAGTLFEVCLPLEDPEECYPRSLGITAARCIEGLDTFEVYNADQELVCATNIIRRDCKGESYDEDADCDFAVTLRI